MEKQNCPGIFLERKNRFRNSFFVCILLVIFSLIFHHKVFAAALNENSDTSFGIANYLPITNTNVQDGDIVSFSPQGYFLSKTPYDTLMVGVVNTNPAISLEVTGQKSTYPVIATGNTYVNVTTSNGNIKKGDHITSSTILGKGMKATQTGYIIGSAIEDYSSSNTHAVKKLAINLNIHKYLVATSVKNSIFNIFNLSTLATYEEPIQAFKYFIAAVTVILSFIFCFFSFARTANKGLEALGRNPLAGRTIELGILLNIIVAVMIVLVGLLVAFVVIRL
jgi:F0F1-type ATP synthase membrane subunit c/vacuolar-type H+-ATPase subunit K